MPDLLRADFLSISGSQKESAKAPLQTSSSEFKLANHFSPPSIIDFRMLRIFFPSQFGFTYQLKLTRQSIFSRSCWFALDGHQISVCVCLSTWLVVCCWCHALSCLLSEPALVISLLFQLRHLCLPRYPPRLSPHLFSWCLQSCAV